MHTMANGETYVADAWGEVVWKFECACGHVWEILKSNFPGRRKMKYCGRPECVFRPNYKPPKRIRMRGVSMSIYLAQDLVAWASGYSAKHSLTFSAVVNKAMTNLRIADMLE
jgi:hypothetical protein